MEYENIIFELELLGGAGDLCAEKYIFPLQSGRLALTGHLTPNDLCYLPAAACLREVEDANHAKRPGYELVVKGELLKTAAPHGDCRHTAVKNASAMAFCPLCRRTPGRGCCRGLLLQRQPFYAVVPADDGTKFRHVFERVPPERRR